MRMPDNNQKKTREINRRWKTDNWYCDLIQGTLGTLRCQRSLADRPDQFRRTHRSQQQEELEVKMMFVLLAITVVFTVSWAPLQVTTYLNAPPLPLSSSPPFYPHFTVSKCCQFELGWYFKEFDILSIWNCGYQLIAYELYIKKYIMIPFCMAYCSMIEFWIIVVGSF